MIRENRWLLALIIILLAALVAINLLMPKTTSTRNMPYLLEHEVRSIPPPLGWKLIDTEASNKGSAAGFEMEYAGTASTNSLVRYFKRKFSENGWTYCEARYINSSGWVLLEFRKSDYWGMVQLSNAGKTTDLDVSDDWDAIGAVPCGDFNFEL
jgi:hypothetical protein